MPQPVDVGEIAFTLDVPIVKIATGKHHVMALDTKGRVWTWGKNDRKQLGHS